jgi:fatty acid desaturase
LNPVRGLLQRFPALTSRVKACAPLAQLLGEIAKPLLICSSLTDTSLDALTLDAPPTGEARAYRGRSATVEWPTVALALFIYGGWLTVTWHFTALPLWLSLPLGAVFVVWHSSLQHEVLHGHPTRWRKLNHLVGLPSLTLWLPYERYRQTHLTHHIDERLTDPLDDPESYYVTHRSWQDSSPLVRALLSAQTTLLGRITIGPYWAIGRFLMDEAQRIAADAPCARRIWRTHALAMIPVIAWITLVCGIPLWLYIVGMAVPGTALMMIRSFAEHRALPNQPERTAIVENSWFFGPLFLFNNLHVVHHDAPTMPWYRLPGWYKANRAAIARQNGGLIYNTYFDVARRYLLRPHDTPQHPLDGIARAAE